MRKRGRKKREKKTNKKTKTVNSPSMSDLKKKLFQILANRGFGHACPVSWIPLTCLYIYIYGPKLKIKDSVYKLVALPGMT